MAFTEVPTKRKSELVVEQVLSEIAAGRLVPGDRLPSEEKLAKEIGVGRSSVREAMTLLRLHGIIETKHGDGSTVKEAEPFRDDLSSSLRSLQTEMVSPFDIFVARECIEPSLVRLAVESATTAQIEIIEGKLEDMIDHAKHHNLHGCFVANVEYHQAVMKATNNEVVELLILQLYDLMKEAYGREGLWEVVLNAYHCSKYDCSQCISDHDGLLKAIVARDVSKARAHYKSHFKNVRGGLYEGWRANGG